MAETLEECLARAAACRAAAASEALENVKRVHLEAAASWEMLADRAQWSPGPGTDRPCPRSGIADHALALPFTSRRSARGSAFQARPFRVQVPVDRHLPVGEHDGLPSLNIEPSERGTMLQTDDEGETEPQTWPAGGLETGKVTLYAADGHLRRLREIEADIIRHAIELYRGRMAEVARRLGIGRSTLYRKLSEFGIDEVG